MVDQLLVIVPEEEKKATHDMLASQSILGWEQTIHLEGGVCRRGPGNTAKLEAQRILRLADHLNVDCLIVCKEICCDERVLFKRHDLDVRRPCVGLLRKKVLKDELDLRGLRWRSILKDRLSRWDSKKSDVDHWLKQFDEFNARWVGEGLLRLVDVIEADVLSLAFDLPAQAKIGSNILFTFLSEIDYASSSNRIGAILTRIHGETKDLISTLEASVAGSRVVICEDALWTGTELRKMLKRMSPKGDLFELARDKRITFRHCVVSDYGLWVARHYIELHNLEYIDLQLGEHQRYVRVLDPQMDDRSIRTQWHLSPEEFDEWLSHQVQPMAFRDARLWQGRQQEAELICKNIGSQLIQMYSNDRGKKWSESIKKGFAIGAGRFGCTLMFSHSIPKVCLPLLWLGGRVNIDSSVVDWKPLVFDARRFR